MYNVFAGKSEVYASARPNYPKELFDFLVDNGVINKYSSVADIGAGTGIFSRALAERVKTVYSIDSDIAMLKRGKKIKNVIRLCAMAENTGLKGCSVDTVSVAQAFHWFDAEKFKKECLRILRKDGFVVLVWNDRDENNAFIKENVRVNEEFCKNFCGFSNGFTKQKHAIDKFFLGNFKKAEFSNTYYYAENDFILRCLSSSYAPIKEEKEYDDYISALKKIFNTYQNNGTVNYPYITKCYYGQI